MRTREQHVAVSVRGSKWCLLTRGLPALMTSTHIPPSCRPWHRVPCVNGHQSLAVGFGGGSERPERPQGPPRIT